MIERLLNFFFGEYLARKLKNTEDLLRQEAQVEFRKLSGELQQAVAHKEIQKTRLATLARSVEDLRKIIFRVHQTDITRIDSILSSTLQKLEAVELQASKAVLSDTQIRCDGKLEFQRVGKALSEVHSKLEAMTFLEKRMQFVEEIIVVLTEPKKPGNHIRPGHSFGNEVRL
jgi:hypothetical protein